MIEAILYPIAAVACVAAGWFGRSLVDFDRVTDLQDECNKLAFELRDAASLLLCIGQRIAARKAFKALGLGPDGAEFPEPAHQVNEVWNDGWPTGGAA